MAVAEDENEKPKTSSGEGPVVRDVPAVTRAVAILRSLAKTETPMGVVALAREVNVIPSTCLHILRVLVDEGLVSFEPSLKKYTLGPGVLSLASAFTHRNQFAHVVRPHLEELSRQHRCAFAGIEQSDVDHLVVVTIGDMNPGVSIRLMTGTRLPILMSASGRVFAAFDNYSAAELKKRFGKLRWDHPPEFETWLEEIKQTRSKRYAVDWGHYMKGVAVIAVPVFGGEENLLGCITTVDFREQVSPERQQNIIRDMTSAAHEVGWKLGNQSTHNRFANIKG